MAAEGCLEIYLGCRGDTVEENIGGKEILDNRTGDEQEERRMDATLEDENLISLDAGHQGKKKIWMKKS